MTIHQVIQRLRRLLLVHREVIDRCPHHHQVLLQRRFPRVLNRSLIHPRSHPEQTQNDRNHNHQLNQREPRVTSRFTCRHATAQIPPPLSPKRAVHKVKTLHCLTSPNTSCHPSPCR